MAYQNPRFSMVFNARNAFGWSSPTRTREVFRKIAWVQEVIALDSHEQPALVVGEAVAPRVVPAVGGVAHLISTATCRSLTTLCENPYRYHSSRSSRHKAPQQAL